MVGVSWAQSDLLSSSRGPIHTWTLNFTIQHWKCDWDFCIVDLTMSEKKLRKKRNTEAFVGNYRELDEFNSHRHRGYCIGGYSPVNDCKFAIFFSQGAIFL